MIKEPNLQEYQDLQLNFDMISRGIRSEEMEYETFKYYRRLLNGLVKRRLDGELIHVSSTYGMPKGTGKTYIKPKEIVRS